VELEGDEGDLDKLIAEAALILLQQTQPFRYASLKAGSGHPLEALTIFKQLAATSAGRERAWALAEIGITYPSAEESLTAANEAVRLDPSNPFAYVGRINANAALGRTEQVAQDLQHVLAVIKGSLASDVQPSAVEVTRLAGEAWLKELKGAYLEAAAVNLQQEQRGAFSGNRLAWMEAASNYANAHDGSVARSLLAQHADATMADVFNHAVTSNYALPAQLLLEAASDNWQAAAADLAAADLALRTTSKAADRDDVRHSLIWPWLAFAWAKSGDATKARDLIARTPHDCNLCLVMRGRIAEAAHDLRGAAYWYDRATVDAPSLPFAAFRAGALALAQGKLDIAIAHLRMANTRGPHFADALELWGEALMLQNRSDLALTKFSEASKYAPNWGRLHLKWGEALRYAGHPAEAKAQFAAASSLDVTTDEESEIAKVLSHE
jgi:tetratricopeptide (TPR) repeat protein